MDDLEPREKDMLLMGKLEVMMIPYTQSSDKERERQSYRFVLFIFFYEISIDSVCEMPWWNVRHFSDMAV